MITLNITIKGFENATVQESEQSYFIDLKTGLGVAEYPKSGFTLEEAIEDQVSLTIE